MVRVVVDRRLFGPMPGDDLPTRAELRRQEDARREFVRLKSRVRRGRGWKLKALAPVELGVLEAVQLGLRIGSERKRWRGRSTIGGQGLSRV
jgi:hypothetical protein